MKITAVAVSSTNMKQSVAFYTLLGFSFPELSENDQHIEPETSAGSARLMIDSKELIRDIIGTDPQPGNHSSYAIEFDTPDEVDRVVKKLQDAGHIIIKEPWDAFWGQRYAIVADPDGYKIDLYAYLKQS